jgi:hypothetical protein
VSKPFGLTVRGHIRIPIRLAKLKLDGVLAVTIQSLIFPTRLKLFFFLAAEDRYSQARIRMPAAGKCGPGVIEYAL